MLFLATFYFDRSHCVYLEVENYFHGKKEFMKTQIHDVVGRTRTEPPPEP
jgi:hypothetical protein